jgi:hypothetical protein
LQQIFKDERLISDAQLVVSDAYLLGSDAESLVSDAPSLVSDAYLLVSDAQSLGVRNQSVGVTSFKRSFVCEYCPHATGFSRLCFLAMNPFRDCSAAGLRVAGTEWRCSRRGVVRPRLD